MRSGTAGLFADRKRCRIGREDKCMLCGRNNVEAGLY